jgi:UTP--glucose-1-phosphate uridylyltransferase
MKNQKLNQIILSFFKDKKASNKDQVEYITTNFVEKIKLNNLDFDTKIDFAIKAIPLYLEKILTHNLDDLVKLSFVSMYLKYLAGDTGKLKWQDLETLKPQDLVNYSHLSVNNHQLGLANLDQVAVIKLNGGLGTSMGCSGPKSAIPVIDGKSFLEIIAEQIYNLQDEHSINIPFILMNSFNTQEATKNILENKINYMELIQNEFPKLAATTNLPFTYSKEKNKEWNPPGHGDIYISLVISGLLDELIFKGIEYAFISNSDNLGATVCPKILGYMIENNMDFIMETAKKTKEDVKGGTLIRKDGKLNLLERAQVEEAHIAEFEDIEVFKVFNTNSIWINLLSLKEIFSRKIIELPMIANNKEVDSQKVVQLESAMGSAIGSFNKACSIVVERDRFLPVKKTSDLMVIQSDYVEKHKNGTVSLYKKRKQAGYPTIKLSKHFEKVADYTQRVKNTPSLKNASKVVLDGDIYIENPVVFDGETEIIADEKLII